VRPIVLCSLLVFSSLVGVAAAPSSHDVWLLQDTKGQTLDSRHSDRLLNPASVLKIATSWWALETLGFDHRFETRFFLAGEIDRERSTLIGDLVVLGGGDPDFHGENGWLVAEALARLGVRRVTGDLRVTPKFYMGWEGGIPYETNSVLRGETMGRRLRDALDPDRWDRSTRRGLEEFAGRSGRSLESFPSIRFAGDVVGLSAEPPIDGLSASIVHRSNPLPILLKRFTSYSNNDIDRLSDTLGQPAELGRFLTSKLNLSEDRVEVGSLSGLETNRLSCDSIVSLLDAYASFVAQHDSELADLLPANGCDPGTLENFPGLESLPAATIVAKTGTLLRTDDGVSVVAGVLQTDEGQRTFCRAALKSGRRTLDARHDAENWLLASIDFTPSSTIGCGAPVVHSDDDVELEVRHPRLPLAKGENWPGFLGRNGRPVSEEGPLPKRYLKETPPVRWHVEAGEGYAAPSIADRTVYFFDRVDAEARLRAIDASSGRTIWESRYPTDYVDTYQFSNGPRSSPVIADGRVYTFGVEGRLRSHSTDDGRLLWEIDTTAKFGVVQNCFGVGSTPVIENDLLIVPVGGSPPDSPPFDSGETRGNGSGVVAFDRKTGETRYAISNELASYASPVLTTIDGRRWAFVLARGGLIAFDPTTGAIDFEFPWRASRVLSVNAANPVVVGNEVLISEAYGPGSALLRVRPGGYEVVWKDARRDKSLLSHWSTPIHRDGRLFGIHGYGTADVHLRAIEWKTGRLIWKSPLLERSTALLVDDLLVVAEEGGEVHLVKAQAESYEKLNTWRFAEDGQSLLRRPVWNAPVLSHGLLFLRGRDRLIAIDLLTEKSP